MWFLTLFAALFLGETGETVRGSRRGQNPDSHAAFSPGNLFPISPFSPPSCISKHACTSPCPCTLPSPSQSSFPYQFPPIFQNFLFSSHLTISGILQSFQGTQPLTDLGTLVAPPSLPIFLEPNSPTPELGASPNPTPRDFGCPAAVSLQLCRPVPTTTGPPFLEWGICPCPFSLGFLFGLVWGGVGW